MNKNKIDIVLKVIQQVPQVLQHLSMKARWIIAINSGDATKSYQYYLDSILNLVTATYKGNLGTVAFTDSFASLIAGQMRNAYNEAWYDLEFGGETSAAFPDYLEKSLMNTINTEQNMNFIYQFYNDIVAGRIADSGVNQFYARAELWATRWTQAYNEAVRLITLEGGGKLMWVEGDTEDKCVTCLALNGIVALASTWEKLGVKPQSAPNPKLQCDGWRCGCYLEPTEKRLSPNAKDRIKKALRLK